MCVCLCSFLWGEDTLETEQGALLGIAQLHILPVSLMSSELNRRESNLSECERTLFFHPPTV